MPPAQSKTAEPDIQVDCFSVGLGAAMLLQFCTPDGTVRVLADGGYQTKEYKGRVNERLSNCIHGFHPKTDGTPLKIHLVVATHYDGDHLKGLIPVVENRSIEIEEIWLPPVQFSTPPSTITRVEAEDAVFVKELQNSGDDALEKYLLSKLQRIQDVDDLAGFINEQVSDAFNESQNSDATSDFKDNGDNPEESIREILNSKRHSKFHENLLMEFGKIESALSLTIEWNTEGHCNADGDSEDDTYFRAIDSALEFFSKHPLEHDLFPFRLLRRKTPEHSNRLMQAIASVKLAPVKDAIVAIHLSKLIKSVRARGNIRVRTLTIDKGKPRFFSWESGRFSESEPTGLAGKLELHLLAPSRQLVAKLHRRIPVAVEVLAYENDPHLNSEAVSASNRLSYVIRFDLNGGSVLIAGDSGFSDFSEGRGAPTDPNILKLLRDLDVVQVAHHGGHSHRFYQALDEAKLLKKGKVLLLLSHAVADEFRPSPVFSEFLLKYSSHQPYVLFTSSPRFDKISSIQKHIYPIAPEGATPLPEADVRLTYYTPTWHVETHRAGEHSQCLPKAPSRSKKKNK